MKNAMQRIGLAVAAFGLLAGTAQFAQAGQVLTFDDLPADTNGIPITTYGGFTWQNFYALDATDYGSGQPNGYTNGRVSGNNVAYNGFGSPASVIVTAANTFTFNSVYLTAAWNNGLNIEVDGYNNGNLVDTATVTVNTFAPTQFVFDWTNIDSLKFTSFGGVSAGYFGAGEHFAMDNFATDFATTTPEPSTLLSGAIAGLVGVGYGWRRRKANAAA